MKKIVCLILVLVLLASSSVFAGSEPNKVSIGYADARGDIAYKLQTSNPFEYKDFNILPYTLFTTSRTSDRLELNLNAEKEISYIHDVFGEVSYDRVLLLKNNIKEVVKKDLSIKIGAGHKTKLDYSSYYKLSYALIYRFDESKFFHSFRIKYNKTWYLFDTTAVAYFVFPNIETRGEVAFNLHLLKTLDLKLSHNYFNKNNDVDWMTTIGLEFEY